MSTSFYLVSCWLGLVLLSVATVQVGTEATLGLMAVVLVLALAKAWLIAERFMGLHRSPLLWRGLLLGWPLVMVAAIAVTLHLP